MRQIATAALLTLTLTGCGGLQGPVAGLGPSSAPTSESSGLGFALASSYPAGERIEVRLRNRGPDTYRYNSSGYAACDLTYTDAGGREFLVPPGTHCDMVTMESLLPGQTVTLFHWELDECVRDEWGCVEAEPLPPGEYTIRGQFERVGGGTEVTETTFRITA